MYNLASVDKDNKVSKTSCCNAPIKVSSTNGFFICGCCGTEVTLVPEFADLSPQEKLMKQKAIANKNKAKEVHEDALDHLARICIADYCEALETYAEEQYQHYLDVDVINMSPVALKYITEITNDPTRELSPCELLMQLHKDQCYMNLVFNYTIGDLATKAQVDKHTLAQRVLELETYEPIKKALNDYIQS